MIMCLDVGNINVNTNQEFAHNHQNEMSEDQHITCTIMHVYTIQTVDSALLVHIHTYCVQEFLEDSRASSIRHSLIGMV